MRRSPAASMLTGLVSPAAWYVGAAGVRTLLTLALLPIYLTQLTPSEFGQLGLANILISLLRAVSGLGITSGMGRHVTEAVADGDAVRARLATGTALIVAQAGASVTVLLLAASGLIFGTWITGGNSSLYIATLAAIGLAPSFDILGAQMRAAGHAREASGAASLTQVVTTGVSAVLLLAFGAGPTELIVTQAAVLGLGSAGLLVAMRDQYRLHYHRALARVMWRFGVPTLPALVADWTVQFSDRLFLNAIVGLEATGIYSLASRAAQLLNDILTTGLYQAWSPYVFATHDTHDAPARLARVTNYFAAAAMAFAVPLVVGAHEAVRIFTTNGYGDADMAIAILTFGFWLAFLRQLFLAPAGITKRTEANLPSWIGGMLCNVALNALLIPPFGIEGAAVATAVSYMLAALLAALFGRRLWRIPYDWGRLVWIGGSGGLVAAVWWYVPIPFHPVISAMTAAIGSLACFVVMLWFSGFLSRSDRAWCRSQLDTLRKGPAC